MLVGFVIYDQRSAPVVDAVLDWQTGVVLEVPFGSFADWNGFHVGDIIPSVEGVLFSEWQRMEAGFIEESIGGVVREGALGALFAGLVILVFLNFSCATL
jgi:hypothetical protein